MRLSVEPSSQSACSRAIEDDWHPVMDWLYIFSGSSGHDCAGQQIIAHEIVPRKPKGFPVRRNLEKVRLL